MLCTLGFQIQGGLKKRVDGNCFGKLRHEDRVIYTYSQAKSAISTEIS